MRPPGIELVKRISERGTYNEGKNINEIQEARVKRYNHKLLC